jgi:hypothetical protein
VCATPAESGAKFDAESGGRILPAGDAILTLRPVLSKRSQAAENSIPQRHN